MSLRYRLFLGVSALFLVAALISLFIGSYVTRTQLKKAQEDLRTEILGLNEAKRENLERYLASSIAEAEARVDAVLNNISRFRPQIVHFGPTIENEKTGTWKNCADLLLTNKEIDFIQNTNEGKTTAVIVPYAAPLNSTLRYDINDGLAWVYIEGIDSPYLGVRLPLIAKDSLIQEGEVIEESQGIIPAAFLLFNKDDLQRQGKCPLTGNPETLPVPWSSGYVLSFAHFIKSFNEACQSKRLELPDLSYQTIQQEIAEEIASKGGKLNTIPSETFTSSVPSNLTRGHHLEEVALRDIQMTMIWTLLTSFETGVFGPDLFAFPAPVGLSIFSERDHVGVALQTQDVCFPSKLYDDSSYYQSHAPKTEGVNIGTSLSVIDLPAMHHVFFGNTAEFGVKTASKEREGFLTLGFNGNALLEKLILVVQQSAFMVHEGAIKSAFAADGTPLSSADIATIPISQMLKQKTGTIPWGKENYFFIQLTPFPHLDLHYFLLNPEEKEFALLNDLEQGSQNVVNTMLFDIHMLGLGVLCIALISLNFISRRITRPITQLAMATRDIGKGKLDDVRIPVVPLKQKDEIAQLCHSFEEMVQGLKEKEKVKGVLNKVVSTEIAQEILKGNVHLGGEEKNVTVLFADIRNFTSMTQEMQPKDVIELLNVCMTKISSVIDMNGGVIDKYVGDEAMALFGAPVTQVDGALKAITSAIEIQNLMHVWNQERAAIGLPAVNIGIGIHTGAMLAGNMGAENRLNYTVIGRNVNLAARLCSAAAPREILISESTLEEPFIKEKIAVESLPPSTLKGFDKPISIYRVNGMKP